MQSLEQELALQERILPGVSRTFALTIPQLPGSLRVAVTNAYLLCRVADTIEDDAGLSATDKQRFHEQFVAVVTAGADADALAAQLPPALSPTTPQEERELVAQLAPIVRITRGLPDPRRGAIERCVRIMCSGMPGFQREASVAGLPRLEDLERYCYYVAGVVGEMLTELFTDHLPQIRGRRDELMRLAVPFGQGLQMTNILKDFWEDRRRGACWLPRSVFEQAGLDLAQADQPGQQVPFAHGLNQLIGVAHACLRDALAYVRVIPRREIGIRRFCLWAIGLAALTLKNIHHRPNFRRAEEVKVSRRALRLTLGTANLFARSNLGLSLAFNTAAAGLPIARDYGVRPVVDQLRDGVSRPESG